MKRPDRFETEEDLLRLQEEYLSQNRKPAATGKQVPANEDQARQSMSALSQF